MEDMEIKVRLKLTYDPNRKKNFLNITMGEGTFHDDDKNKIGYIRGIIPLGLQLHSEKTKRTYIIDLEQMFNAFIEKENANDTQNDQPAV